MGPFGRAVAPPDLPSLLPAFWIRGDAKTWNKAGKAEGGEAEVNAGKSISLESSHFPREDRHLAALTKQRQL